MNETEENLILQHWRELVKKCKRQDLYPKLLDKNIISAKDIETEFTGETERDSNRSFFFHLMKQKGAFPVLIQALRDSQQGDLASLLHHKHHNITVFRLPQDQDIVEVPRSPVVKSAGFIPLVIKVKRAETFLDTDEHNKQRQYYSTRSKRRGQVLIINNYGVDKNYRQGAEVDDRNLRDLFGQLHFDISFHSNQTREQMRDIIEGFARFSPDKVSDICVVILMSHGDDHCGDTMVQGQDGLMLSCEWIEEQFNNIKCPLFRNKPKVILYQVCRGDQSDVRRPRTTQTDSASLPHRTVEDMLVGHSTLKGYVAHRDTELGTWYISLFCEMLMDHGWEHPMDDLLGMIDQRMRGMMSEKFTVQTPEYTNRGFKKCYLHPGIYEEGGKLCKYDDINK